MNFQYDGYITKNGSEFECRIEYDYEPPEYNWGANVVPTAAWHEDEGCILHWIEDDPDCVADWDALVDRCWDHYNAMGEMKAAMEEDRADAMREEPRGRI